MGVGNRNIPSRLVISNIANNALIGKLQLFNDLWYGYKVVNQCLAKTAVI